MVRNANPIVLPLLMSYRLSYGVQNGGTRSSYITIIGMHHYEVSSVDPRKLKERFRYFHSISSHYSTTEDIGYVVK